MKLKSVLILSGRCYLQTLYTHILMLIIKGGHENMVKNPVLLYKTLVVGVIVIFIGVGIQPAFAVNIISTDNEEDCSICLPVNRLQVVRFKSLLNRLERYSDALLLSSKLNPIVADKYKELSDSIAILTEMDVEYISDLSWNFPILCLFLFILFVFAFILLLLGTAPNLVFIIGDIGKALNCTWPSP